ncbi:iron-sulfur cluster carrier protein ApbC [Dasania sp. GY-MA-18]|uniref:Iron-sulfur cluster carrier protein n=1 Tax=Dasania phycosphaerae TaxID=2950436 RepID=A0A9J6RQP1_9GAMM|nr:MULTISPECIES: iron-sulfur cluster carrier protein ApbC [Dasania]MCR8923931.1 iron-sulfur cluster carrier protein ApbC [Dasania sp. GY-MA-18]MCZ0866365.1 iron-sulfur cluster carrier protein ApbC [Dasania phycosphaerae]MCZ0870089.1 iron-sulfur cluster carrier protein ApbC [Dasania phycosphaerae]
MSQYRQQQVEECLLSYVDPHLQRSLLDVQAIKSMALSADTLNLAIELPYPMGSVKAQQQAAIAQHIEQALPGLSVNVAINSQISSNPTPANQQALAGVKNIIAVASGKGGVGKSTTSVNLALALVREGAKVGLLDADIYGPSQALMLGVAEGTRPEPHGDKGMQPISAHGLQSMSMGYLVTEQTPMVWRGPMASGALEQLLRQTHWQALDYLIIDMPPGTGDIQLTLSQRVPVAGSVVVTTPQDIALLDAKKGIEMFNKVKVPVLGVVENMATHICTACGHEEHIFGEGGGQRIAQQYGVPLLGALPLSLTIRQQTDAGQPSVIAEPEGKIASLYGEIARNMAAQLALRQQIATSAIPEIVITND